MKAVLLQTAIYLGTMALGYLLKRLGVFRPEDKKVLGNIIVYLTLPAMLISSFGGIRVDLWFVAAFAVGLVSNALMVLLAMAVSRNKPPELRALYTINGAGFSLGNIAIPYLQGLLPAGIPYLCMFDTADSFFSLGTTYSIACTQLGKKSGSVAKSIFLGLITSVPFDVYVLMTVLSLLQVTLPGPILQAADFIGRSNGCLAMLMVGVSLELRMERGAVKDVLTLMVMRYGAALVFALTIWFLIPAPLIWRQSMAVGAFASVPSICLVYSNKLGVDTTVASALNPLTTLISLPLMAAVLSLLQHAA